MTVLWWARRSLLLWVFGVGALALVVGGINPASGAECKNRGDLDARYCDDNGDLVADTPKDSNKWLDPDTLVFSYTPVEDPAVYENVFKEFMDYLAKKTGKKVKWYGADSYAAQVEAMRSGRLHVAGISTGPTVFGVNLAGYVPVAIMGRADGRFGYKLQLITQKDSDIKKITDLKGRKVAHVTPSSNSGNQAPRALFKSMGLVPAPDYKALYSGKHANSIMGVANKDYDA
ncbi:MAG: phosphate/phosphite/phosphonate ABC transporter substrate-binding protein, partial [Rhodospirillales bacterium]|nr:phosphate/phosphite/phosphonate ABC transporter substrate-binding protein [Rhodospirillales bacterium]